MKVLRELNQGTDAWKAWRREGLGGSDVAALLGISPYEDATRESLFAEKVHGIEKRQNGAMYRGTVLEPHARALYCARARCTAVAACAVHDELPWARVSLDGLCSNGAVIPSERLGWVLELKAPGWETHDAALCGHVPERFQVQCQWQLYVTGLDRCDFASFNPSDRFTLPSAKSWEEWRALDPKRRPPAPAGWLAVVPLAADRDRQEWILGEAAAFWFDVEQARAAFDREARRA